MTATVPHRPTDSSTNAPAPYTDFDRLFIGGRWVTGRSNHKLRPINPYDQAVIMEIPVADKRDIETAYQAAQQAQIGWAKMLPSERSQVMRRAADIMDARRDEIVGWSIREAGSPRKKATLEWQVARDVMKQAIAEFTTDHWVTVQHTPRTYPL